MSTPTETHAESRRSLAAQIEAIRPSAEKIERAIADSEARAIAPLKAARDSDFEVFHAMRMKLTAACGDPYKLHDEALDAIIAERDQLRAEVERLTKEVIEQGKRTVKAQDALEASILRTADQRNRAEKAEADLTAERAMLDAVIKNCWLVHQGNVALFAVYDSGSDKYITPWLETERAAIKAAILATK